MIEKLLAGTALVICIGLLVRLMLPTARRGRVDAVVRKAGRTLHRLVIGRYRNWRLQRSAHRMADDVIRRARDSDGAWTGNVYRPTSFQRPPKDLESPAQQGTLKRAGCRSAAPLAFY